MPPTDQISYMDMAAATTVGRDYKDRFAAALAIEPGHRVADLGCGPGTDLARSADAAGHSGTVVGVDRDPHMLAEARRRLHDHRTVKLLFGDLHHLPLADRSADRARTDRVLQHVVDPARAISEVRRVLRPGGRYGMAEPDWSTLTIESDDPGTSRRFTRFLAAQVRNPAIGRELPARCAEAGLIIRSVEPMTARFDAFDAADRILGLRRNVSRAVTAGILTESRAEGWLRGLAGSSFQASFAFYLVSAEN